MRFYLYRLVMTFYPVYTGSRERLGILDLSGWQGVLYLHGNGFSSCF
jgi:hypothetical protein